MFFIAARFQVPNYVQHTPYILDSSANAISLRIASIALLASNSGEWFFRFIILERTCHAAMHLKNRFKFPRPPIRRKGRLH
jgi:hypothetical protein